ncbi:unnamed protein product [Cyclocybe aegerita]|uniref:Uncharacterized protein n=1 Tax=Cyclocybe aegerita TaxID=1973307 RepID=A0A8S0WY14_CYCAE|nr:unnamed protein product [Cyclocybe aegerita]
MIILDEDLDSGQTKTDSDNYPGLTLRHPQAVHARSSTSTLPDYDTSEAQHRKVITRSTLSLGNFSARVWKIVIGVLLGYTVLSLAIGLPIILLKGRDRDDSFSLAPTSSLWVSEDVVLPGPLQLATTGIPTTTNNMTCNIWDTHPDIENTQFARFQLPPQGLITIRSNVTYEKVAADNINGTLWVYMNQDKKEKDIIFNVSMKSSSNNVRLQTNVCFSEQGSSRGLTIYVPDTLGVGDLLTFNVLALLPQRKASIDQFLVYLPLLEHRIGYVQKQIEVTQFTLEGAARPMSCEFLQACQITFKNIMGSITGSFNVSNSLTLDTIKASIHSNITLTQGRLSPKPVILSMDTGDGDIDASIVLEALSPIPRWQNSPAFVAYVKTFNQPLHLNVSYANSSCSAPVQLQVQNNMCRTTVALDETFQGSFSAQSKLSQTNVQDTVSERAVSPFGGSRTIVYDQKTINRATGWVGWGQRPLSHQLLVRSYVEILSALSPVNLTFGGPT